MTLSALEIQAATADHFNVTIAELVGTSRKREFVRPRQVAMSVCRDMTDLSLHQIGRRFGGRDHTTVLHGCNRIGELATKYDDDVAAIKNAICGFSVKFQTSRVPVFRSRRTAQDT